MGKVSFEAAKKSKSPSKSGKVVEAEVVKEEKPEVAAPVAEETAVAKREEQPVSLLQDDDNIGMDEITLPRINIVQKVGDLSEIYDPGDIVLNKELVIYHPEKSGEHDSLRITVLGFFPTKWSERIPGGELGRLAGSPAEVLKFGGTTDYKTWAAKEGTDEEIPYFQPLATALILIECPEGVDEDGTSFIYEFEDKRYALALWSMKGGAYTNGAKVIKTARKIGCLRKGGYASYDYRFDTKTKKYPNGNFAMIPVLRPGTRHTEEFAAFVQEVLGGGTEEDEKGNLAD